MAEVVSAGVSIGCLGCHQAQRPNTWLSPYPVAELLVDEGQERAVPHVLVYRCCTDSWMEPLPAQGHVADVRGSRGRECHRPRHQSLSC